MELRVNGRAVAVVMRTPGHDEELAAGFLLSEGILRDRKDLEAIRPYPRNREGNVLDVVLADGVAVDFGQLSRQVCGVASCGLCGKASIAALRRRLPPVRERFTVTPATLEACAGAMREAQPGFDRTGGLHAAALFTREGRLRCLREDVGRHNAVDKVVGRTLLDGELPGRHLLLIVSGRVSFEIVQKAAAGGVAFIAAVGAPSGLSVEFARAHGQTLVGFLRDGRFNVYAGRRRVGR